MKMKKKIIVFVIIITFIVPLGSVAYSRATAYETETNNIIEISQQIKDLIKTQDEQNFANNLEKYTKFLMELDVQPGYKTEIEVLLNEGYPLRDILIAYRFLYDHFGTVDELKQMCSQKQSGDNWEDIFVDYNQTNGEFVPSAFDSEQLEAWMGYSGITADDIMLADRVSWELNISFEEVIIERLEELEWKNINEQRGILNSQSKLPRVRVTNELISAYQTEYNLSGDEIVEGFVLSVKLNQGVDEILSKIDAGNSMEEIYAQYLEETY